MAEALPRAEQLKDCAVKYTFMGYYANILHNINRKSEAVLMARNSLESYINSDVSEQDCTFMARTMMILAADEDEQRQPGANAHFTLLSHFNEAATNLPVAEQKSYYRFYASYLRGHGRHKEALTVAEKANKL